MTESGIVLRLAAKTDLGRTRDHNEDTFLVADLTRGTTEFLVDGQTEIGPRGLLLMVADGMGGAAAGELASAMAADLVFQHMAISWGRSQEVGGDDFIRHLRTAVELANTRIHEYAKEHPDARGMGTTSTVVGVLGNRLYLAQVGDSRAYLVREGAAIQLTKDQSLMQRLIDAGELTEEQAAVSERRNIILQALGPDAKIRVDVTYQDLARGDIVILCSDGLSGQVKRDEIADVVTASSDGAAACETLIDLANERGGPDNITVVIGQFDGPGLPPPSTGDDVGYHTYPTQDDDPSGEVPAVEAVEVGEVEVDVALEPAPRSGGPITVAVVGAGLMIILLVLFLLLRAFG